MRISDWSSDVCSSDLQKPLELELSGPMAHSGEQCLFLRAAFRSEGKRQHWPRRSFCDYAPYFEPLWRPMPPFGSHSAHGSRSAERRVGNERVRTGRSRWSASHSKKKTRNNKTQ